MRPSKKTLTDADIQKITYERTNLAFATYNDNRIKKFLEFGLKEENTLIYDTMKKI